MEVPIDRRSTPTYTREYDKMKAQGLFYCGTIHYTGVLVSRLPPIPSLYRIRQKTHWLKSQARVPKLQIHSLAA